MARLHHTIEEAIIILFAIVIASALAIGAIQVIDSLSGPEVEQR